MSDVEKALEEAKAKYGRLVVLEVSGVTMAFKPMDRSKITDIRKKLAKNPDLALELLTNAVEFCCVVGSEHFSKVSTDYPLLFAGDDSVADALMALARGTGSITTR